MPVILRLLVIVVGYLLAALSAGLCVGLLMMVMPVTPWGDLQHFPKLIFGVIALVALFTTLFSGGPALIALGCAEKWGWRHPAPYIGFGAAIGLMLGAMFHLAGWFPVAGVAAGALAGAIYWLVAGRRAGVALQSDSQRKALFYVMLASGCLGTALALNAYFGVPTG